MTAAVSRVRPIPVGRRSAVIMILASIGGLMMFCWPLVISVAATADGHLMDAPFEFILILPVLVLLVLSQLSDGGIDAKALAMLGVLSAINAGLRPLGAGLNGIETVFFLLILAGRVFGPGFGFTLGCTSMFASALLTAGVGPWLPFQMMCSAWIGMGAGLLPHRIGGREIKGRWEIAMLAGYGVLAAYAFGLLMNLWSWPFLTSTTMGDDAGLAYVPGAPLVENLRRFLGYTLITSTASWDTGRAITNAAAIIVLGGTILTVLRRAARRARFDPAVSFVTPTQPPGSAFGRQPRTPMSVRSSPERPATRPDC